MERLKRALSMLLAVIMVISACPVSALATSSEEIVDGDGFAVEVDASLPETEAPGDDEAGQTDAVDAPEDNLPAEGDTVLPESDAPAEEESRQEDAVYSHEDYQYQILADGTISICGYTGVPDAQDEGVYLEIPSAIGDIAVTEIAASAFANHADICGIALPETILTIGDSAFSKCGNLKAIAFWGKLPKLGKAVIDGCESLERIYILSGCDAETFDVLPSNISILEYEILDDLKSAYHTYVASLNAKTQETESPTEATVPVTKATENTASPEISEENEPAAQTVPDAEEINAVSDISDFTYTVLNGTYCQVTGYTGTEAEIRIPSEINGYIVQSIAGNAFKNNTTLTTVVFPETIETIGTYVFAGCTALTDVRLNNGLTNIGGYTFSGCTALTSIALPSTVRGIGEYAFNDCTGLTEVNLPEGLTTIYRYAFQNCTSLASIDLPDSVTTMASQAFYNCTKLSEVGYPAGWTTVLDNYAQSTTYWGDSSQYYTSPFEGCTALKKVEIPEGVTSIPKHAFQAQTALEEVVLPKSLTSISVYAFYGCTKLKTVNLVEGLTAIPAYCFYNCTSLNQLVFPSTVTSVGNYAFYNCTGLRTITMNEGLKTIGSYAFYGCDGVLSLVLNEGLETISNNAFSNCDNLKAVEIPSSVTSIGGNAFDGCSKLTIYCYSGSKAHMVSESEGYTLYLLDEHDHAFTTTVETAPTCTRGGSQILTCSVCGYYYVEILDALGHADGEWTLLRAATCTLDGIRTQNCTVCKEEIDRVYIDAFGHTESEWETISGSCTEGGIRIKRCIVCGGEACRETIPAADHVWGEWIVESVSSVFCTGVEARTCSICQEREEIITDKITVDYTTDDQYGLAHFTIVDATTLEPIPNANIFISTENDGEATLTADADGKLSQVLPVGNIKLSVYAPNYQTRNISLTIKSGENNIPKIGISGQNLVHGELTATEMTYEEMIEAGIDVNDPSNQHSYKYTLVLEFTPEIDWLSIAYYWGIGGAVVTNLYGPTGIIGDGDDYSGPAGGRPGYCYWEIICDGNGVGRGARYTTTTGSVIDIYPVNERFFLIIYGEVHWMKEIYDVELLAINTSQTDTVENLVAELTLPEGMSLAKMVNGEQSLVQYMGSLAEGQSKSVHWYVRGDKAGSYTLSARLKGSMLPFGDTFEYTYTTQEPLKVYAGSAMHLTFSVPDSAFPGEPYTVRIELENVSDKTLYNVSHMITDVDQYRVTEYSDGSIEIFEYPVTGGTGSIFIPEFRPGEVIVIETTTTIMFESELVNYKKQQAKSMMSAAKGLMQGFEALDTGVNMLFDVGEWVNTAVEAIQDYVDDAIITSSEKKQMANSIVRQLQDLQNELSGTPTAGKTRKIQELKDAGVWDEVQAISRDPSVLDGYSGKKLAKLSAKLSAANAIQTEEFDIYDSIQKVIDLMPVRYRLVQSWVATLEGSTTVIPSTIHVTPVGAHYFGVSNVTNYIASLFKLYVADEIADEIPIDIISDTFRENVGYYDALDYVRTTENRASLYNVTGTGGAGFKAWVEPAPRSVYRASTNAAEPDFELSIDNETGSVDENGVLSFTGSGTLSVTPRSQVPGVLCIEMEDGTVARYPMEVVEEHECSSEQWHIAIAPTDTTSGIQVKCCDICGEILDMGEILCCSNHEFAESTESQSPTMDAVGVNVRTCIHCGCAEYAYEDAYSLNGYIYCFDSGTTVEEIVNFFKEKGMTVTMDDFEASDQAATGYTLNYEGKQYQIVITGDIDGDAEVTIFDLVEIADYINGEAELTGAGLEAALSDIDESEPTIFDALSIVDQVNGVE